MLSVDTSIADKRPYILLKKSSVLIFWFFNRTLIILYAFIYFLEIFQIYCKSIELINLQSTIKSACIGKRAHNAVKVSLVLGQKI